MRGVYCSNGKVCFKDKRVAKQVSHNKKRIHGNTYGVYKCRENHGLQPHYHLTTTRCWLREVAELGVQYLAVCS